MEYSTNGGASWINISNISGGTRQFVWNVPNTVSGECHFRLSRGGQSHWNAEPFTIIPTADNLQVDYVCANSVGISWDPVIGAVEYEVYMLGQKYMDPVGRTANANYEITGLNPNDTHWFSVAAITGDGTTGRRAIAVEQVPGTINCVVPIDAVLTTTAEPSSGTYPTCVSSATAPVTISVTNNGGSPLSNLPVGFQVNSGTVVNETITGPIAPGTTVSYTFTATADLSTAGGYFVSTWTAAPGDGNTGNDTLVTNLNVVTGSSVTLPFNEDFESFNTCGTGSNCGGTVCALGNGWNNWANGTEDDHDWRTDEGGTPSSGTGPSLDHNPGTSSGNYLYLEASAGCNNTVANMISPCVDLTGATAPQMSFWYHMFGGNMGELHIDLYSNGAWVLDAYPPLAGDQGNQSRQGFVNLSPYAGQTVLVRFRGITGGDYESDMAIDDISIANVAAAPITDFRGNTAVCQGGVSTFSDLSGNAPNAWQWSFSPAVTYVNGSATSQNPTVQFSTTGAYTVTLIASNANGADTLTRTGYVNVSSGNSLPITENFESFNNCATTSNCGATACPLGNGWVNVSNGAGDDIDWRVDNNGTPSDDTGPDIDHNPGTSGGKYVYLEASNGCEGQVAQLLSPCIDLSAAAVPSLSFWYHMWGFNQGELHVDILAGNGWNLDVMPALIGDQGNQWKEGLVGLAPFAGQAIQIRFRGITGDGYASDVALDDIVISNNSSLPAADFTADRTGLCVGGTAQFTDLTANIPGSWSWTFTPNTVTYQGNTSSTSANPLVQFNAAGSYTVSLTATNGNGNDTETKTAYITVSNPTSLPFTEDFQSGTFPPAGWLLQDPGGSVTWASASVPGATGGTTLAAKMDNANYSAIGARDRLISLPVSLPASNQILMTFDVSHARHSQNYEDGLLVEVSTDCGATWMASGYQKEGTDLATAPDQTAAWTPASAGDWRKDSVDLTAFAGQDVVIAVTGINGFGNNVYVDNINLTGSTLNTPVADFTFPSTVCEGETVTFMDASSNSPTTWSWNFGSGTPGTATGAGPHNVTFLSAGTVTVTLTAGNSAGSDVSTQTVTVQPAPLPTATVTLSSGPTPACHEDQLSFSVAGTNTGTNPVYTWKVNGAVVQTGTQTTYSGSNFWNGDRVTCELTSDATCAAPMTVTSNIYEVAISGSVPVANFSFSNTGGTYDFTDQTTGLPTAWAWDFGDGNTSTSQNPTHQYFGSGTFNITLIVSNGCGTDTITQSITGRTPDLPEGSLIQVFPNPSEGAFTVQLSGFANGGSVEWQVMDLQARILQTSNDRLINGGLETRIDLSGQSKGMYLLRLQNDGHTFVRKLIVK